ncbi:MAG: hypothetical protein WBA61_12055 [Aequorivita sp.]
MPINVETDFGAIGNGIINDSSFIQNAINSLTSSIGTVVGGEIFFPQVII